MSEAKQKLTESRSISTPGRSEERGIVRLVVEIGAEWVERTSVNVFQGIRELREELQTRTTELVDQLEKVEHGVNRALRVVVGQGHVIARDAIDSVEVVVTGVTRSLRGVATAATELAARAVVGQPNPEIQAARASA